MSRRHQGVDGDVGKEDSEAMLINDLSKDLISRLASKERSYSPNGWSGNNRIENGSGTNDQKEDDFFSQYLGKNSFNFNASAEILKEVEQMHTSTGYIRGFEDSAVESDRKLRPPSPTVAALLSQSGRGSSFLGISYLGGRGDQEEGLRMQLEDITKALVREKGLHAEREQEVESLRQQLAEERKASKERERDRTGDYERDISSLRRQVEEKETELAMQRRNAQEVERQRDSWRGMAGEREGSLKGALERYEHERETWRRNEEDRQRRFDEEVIEARRQLQSEWDRERQRWKAREELKDKEIAMLSARTQEASQDRDQELINVEERCTFLRNEVESLRSLLEDRDAIIDEMRARESEYEDVTSIFNTENETMVMKTKGLEQEIERNRKELDKLRKDVYEKDVALASLEQQSDQYVQEIQFLKKKVGELEPKQNTTHHEEMDKLQERLKTQAEVMKRTEELHRTQLGDLTKHLQHLVEQYQSIDNDRAREFEELQDENAKLHSDNTQLHSDNTSLRNANSQLQTERSNLQSDHARLQAESAKIQSESAKLQAERTQERKEISDAERTRTQELVEREASMRTQVEDYKKEIQGLRDQLEEMTIDKNESEQAVESLNAHVAELARAKDNAIVAMQAQAARFGQEKDSLSRKLDDVLRSQFEPKESRTFSASPVPPASPPAAATSPNMNRSLARTPSPTHPKTISITSLRTPGRPPHFQGPPPSRPLPPHPSANPPPPRPSIATDPVLYIHQQLQNLHEQQQFYPVHYPPPSYSPEEETGSQMPLEYGTGGVDAMIRDHDLRHSYDGSASSFTFSSSHTPHTPHTPHNKLPFTYPPPSVETAPSTSIPSLYNHTRASHDEGSSSLHSESSHFIRPASRGSESGPPIFNHSTSPHTSHDTFHNYLPPQPVHYTNPSSSYPPPFNPASYNPVPPSYHTPTAYLYKQPPPQHEYHPYTSHPNLENILHHVMSSRQQPLPSSSYAPPPPPSSFQSKPARSSIPPSSSSTQSTTTGPIKQVRPNNTQATKNARPTNATRTQGSASTHTHAPPARAKAAPGNSSFRSNPSPASSSSSSTHPRSTSNSKARSSPRLWK